MYSFEGWCLDVSGRWLPAIEAENLRGYLQQTSSFHIFSIEDNKIIRSPIHFFIAFNHETDNEIILDPTYGQFFEGAEKLGLPRVLVAKTSDIKEIFANHAAHLRVEVPVDELKGKYNPKEVAELLYSTGQFSKFRTSLHPAKP